MNREQRRAHANEQRKKATKGVHIQHNENTMGHIQSSVNANRSNVVADTVAVFHTPGTALNSHSRTTYRRLLSRDAPLHNELAFRFAGVAQFSLTDAQWVLQHFDNEVLTTANARLLMHANRSGRLLLQVLADTERVYWSLESSSWNVPVLADFDAEIVLKTMLNVLHHLHQFADGCAERALGFDLQLTFRAAAQSLARTQYAVARLLLRIQAAQYPTEPVAINSESHNVQEQTTIASNVARDEFGYAAEKQPLTPILHHRVTEHLQMQVEPPLTETNALVYQ
jgi:hypothetical protein